jgi:hypothetical protein
LFSRFIKSVEGEEKLFLGAFFSGDKLNVIHKQGINFSEPAPEFGHMVSLKRADELVNEIFGRGIVNASVGASLNKAMGDGVKKVGFAKANTTVNKKRIEPGTRLIRDLETAGVCQLIRGADDKSVERIFWVQEIGFPQSRRRRRGRQENGPGVWGRSVSGRGALGEFNLKRDAFSSLQANHITQNPPIAIVNSFSKKPIRNLDGEGRIGAGGLARSRKPALICLRRNFVFDSFQTPIPQIVHIKCL